MFRVDRISLILSQALYFKAPLKALPTGVAQVEERRQITPTSFSQSLTPKTDWYDNILDSTDSNNEAIGDSLIVTHCGNLTLMNPTLKVPTRNSLLN